MERVTLKRDQSSGAWIEQEEGTRGGVAAHVTWDTLEKILRNGGAVKDNEYVDRFVIGNFGVMYYVEKYDE